MNDNCPDLQHNPTTKVPLHPSEHTPTTLTTMFGLWMVVEKRKRRPQTKEAVGKCTTNGVSVTESRFTPIFYSNTDDPASPKFARPSTTSQSAAHKRIFKTKSTPPKQASASLKSKGKTSTVAQHTAAFNVLTSRLDGNKHSSISLPENSDPNIPNDDFSLMANNVIGEPPRKPPDLIHFASPKMGQAQKALPEVNRSTLATLVYASPNAQKRKALWFDLNNLAHSICYLWFLVGDFNATLSDSDRQGCAASARPSKAFRKLVFDHGLRDMGFSGPEFTWSRGMAQVRLDCVLCNSYWDETYSESIVHNLFRMKSDHRPIMLSVGDSEHVNRSKHFRYFSGWLSHDDFPRMVQDNSQSYENIVDTIKNFVKAAAI
ncbi:hypothetical protein V6N13_083264 [Hibiscus sabdariffa]